MDNQVPEDLKQERYERVMALSARISAEKLERKVGTMIDVLIDAVDDETGGATGRSKADAPDIDGEVHLRDAGGLKAGDIVPCPGRGCRRARSLRGSRLTVDLDQSCRAQWLENAVEFPNRMIDQLGNFQKRPLTVAVRDQIHHRRDLGLRLFGAKIGIKPALS